MGEVSLYDRKDTVLIRTRISIAAKKVSYASAFTVGFCHPYLRTCSLNTVRRFSRMWRTYIRYVGHYINLLTRNTKMLTDKKQEAHDQFGMHNMYSSVCRRNYSLFSTTKEMNHVPPLLPSCTKQSNVLRRNWNEENYRFLLEEG